MTEQEFLDFIDCNFPYFDEKKWKELVLQSFTINNNAVFCILDEVCRPPQGTLVPMKIKTKIFDFIVNNFKDYNVYKEYFDLINKVITKKNIKIDEVFNLMRNVRKFDNHYALLTILYFSYDDVDGLLEDLDRNTRNYWDEKTI